MFSLYKRPKLKGIVWLLDRFLLYLVAIIISIVLSAILSPTYEEPTVEELYKMQMEDQ